MNSLKDETIHKIFGARLQGSIGLALSLVGRASMINWEALWPQMQRAMIGLSVAAIAVVQGEAIRRGLSELADRIASFQPVASPMPGEALTRAEAMPVPYIPVPSIPIPRWRDYIATQDAFDDALVKLIDSPSNDPKRKDLCRQVLETMHKMESMLETHGSSGVTERLFGLAYKWLKKKGCWETTFPGGTSVI